ncbi:MAG: Bax inhibitor-1/YccA family protein [Bacteroidetes bacterium]|nr:Bax inhibitor-1/YccA family protein [Bacteroidota bacterium]
MDYRQTNMNQFATQNSSEIAARSFMTQVFGWMSGALFFTAITSWLFYSIPSLSALIYNVQDGHVVGWSGLGYLCIFSPLILVFAMSLGFQRFSLPVLIGIFMLYSVLNGVSLSSIFLRYQMNVIGATFAISAGMFGTMAFMGWITKADLSKMGTFLYMALIGLVIAMVVNFFMHSQGFSYLISIAGVIIFTGLTAWDVQKLKNIGANVNGGDTAAGKLSIMGALTLYLDFLNIFLFLLRLMGNRR